MVVGSNPGVKMVLAAPLSTSTELQLNQANSSNTEAPFLDLDLSITIEQNRTQLYPLRVNRFTAYIRLF